jgi:hypothetical protein
MTRFKKILLGLLGAATLFTVASIAMAQTSPNYWLISGSYLKPLFSTYGLQLPTLTNKNCLGTDASGHVQNGTCSGGSSSTTQVSSASSPYLTVAQSGSNATITALSVLSLSNNASAGGVNFSSATGTNIQGTLNSLALSQFTGVLSVANGGTATNTLASLTSGSSPNLTVTGGQNVLIGTSTQISLGGNVISSVSTGTSGSIFNIATSTNSLTLNIPFASASNTGQLQGSDWTTFNNKLGSYNVISVNNLLSVSTTTNLATLTVNESPSFTGTLSVTGTSTLATTTITNLTVSGTSTHTGTTTLATTTVNGLLTVSQLGSCTIVNSVSGVFGCNGTSYLTGNQTITLSGDITGSGATSIATTLATVNGNVGSFTNANITVNAKGLITAASNGSGGSGSGVGTTSPFSAGYIPEATGTNVTLSNSNIFQSTSGNIGINSSTPNYLLSVGNNAWIDSSGNSIANNATDTTLHVGLMTVSAAGFNLNYGVGGFLTVSGSTGAVSPVTTVNLSAQVSGVLSVLNGGTGNNAVTASDILFGNGTSPIATSSSFTYASSILTTPAITLSNLTGTQCLTETSGVVSGSGSACTPAGVSSLGLLTGSIALATSTGGNVFTVTTSTSPSLITFNLPGNLINNVSTTTPSGNLFYDTTSTLGSVNTLVEHYPANLINNVSTSSGGSYGYVSTSSVGSVNSLLINFPTSSGGSGNSAWTLGLGDIYNATSTDSVLIGASSTTSPATLFLQGRGQINPFFIASSTGIGLLQVAKNGALSLGTTTNTSLFYAQGTSTNPTLALFTLASSSGQSLFNIDPNGLAILQPTATSTAFQILNPSGQQTLAVDQTATLPGLNVNAGTSTQISSLYVQGTSASSTAPVLVLASSTGATLFDFDSYGHSWTGGTAPTCGTGCSSVTGDDSTFRIVTGSSVTAVTVNFASTWINPKTGVQISPSCVGSDESGGTTTSDPSSTPTSVTINLSAALTTKNLSVQCRGSLNFAN